MVIENIENIEMGVDNIYLKKLEEANCIKKGLFKLKSNQTSNIYFNLKNLISYPKILSDLCNDLYRLLLESYEFNTIYSLLCSNKLRLCGVAFGGIPLCCNISTTIDCPMIFARDTIKKYGTQRQIEGEYSKDDRCIIIEDVITTGASVKQIIDILKPKIKIMCILTLINRNNIETIDGFKVISLINLKSVLKID